MIAGSLELQLLASVARLQKDMDEAKRIVGGAMGQIEKMATLAGRALGAIGVGLSVGALAAMVRNVNNVVDAMNDLKDATGASIENISALEDIARRNGATLDTVGTALTKFNQALSGTVKPGTDAEQVLKGIGLNAEELRKLDPAEAMMKTAQALSQYADDGGKARAVQELFGKSLREVAPLLKDMAEAGKLNATVTTQQAEEAEKFNKHLFALQKNITDVARALVGNLVPALNSVIDTMRNKGLMAGLDQLGNQLFDWEGNALRKGLRNAERELARLQSIKDAISPSDATDYAEITRAVDQQAAAIAKLRAEYFKLTNVQGGRGNVNPPLADMRASLEGVIKDAPKAAKAVKEVSEAEKDLAAHMKYRREQQMKATDEYLKALAAEKEAADNAYRSLLDGSQKSVEALDEEIRKQVEANARIGLTAEAVEALEVAKLRDLATSKERQAAIALDIDFSGRMSDKLLEEAAKWRKLADAKEAGIGKKAAVEGADEYARQAKRAQDEFERTNQQIADSFVDNLMRGGKSVWQYLKDLFRTLILRPILQPIGNMMASAVTGITGSLFPGMASAAAGSMGLPGMFGAGSGLSAALFGTGGGGSAIATSAGALEAGALVEGVGGTTGLLAAIPGWGWAAMAAAAVAAMLAKGGETRVGGQYSGTGFVGGPSGGQISGAQDLLGATMGGINATLKALGASSTLMTLVSGLEQSQNGKGFAYAGGALSSGATFGQGLDGQGFMNRRGSMTDKEALAAFVEELSQARLEAIQASDAIGPLADWVRSLGDVSLLTGESLSSTIARLDKALTEKQALEDRLFAITATEAEQLARARDAERSAIDSTNLALLEQVYAQEDLKRANEEAAEAASELAAAQKEAAEQAAQAAADLMDKLMNAAPFYMTADEERGFYAQQIASQFTSMTGIQGITPEQVLALESAEGVRAIWDQAKADGNQAIMDALWNLDPLFRRLFKSVQDIAAEAQAAQEAIEAEQKRIADERYGLETRLLTLQGDTAALRARELALLDPTNHALMKQIWALEDAKAAEDARTAALERQRAKAQQLRDEWERLTGSMMEEVRRLRGEVAGGTPQQSLAYLQTQFAIAAAAARAGDLSAGQRLTGLSQAVEEAAMRSVGSLPELNTIRSQLADSLEGVASSRGYNDGSAAVVAKLDEVLEENRALRAELKESGRHQRDTAETLEQFLNDPGSLTVTVA